MLVDKVGASALPRRLKPFAMVYGRCANDEDGSRCFPSASFVAGYLSVKPCVARRRRNELIALGVLEARTVREGKRHRINVVAFHAEKLPAKPPDQRYGRTANRYGRTAGNGTAVPRTTSWNSKDNARSREFQRRPDDAPMRHVPDADETAEYLRRLKARVS